MNNNLISHDECRTIMLNILMEIDKICKENDIRYYLAGGTLLGAIRHHGFIPWDDDIDIILHREDYNKLINILKYQDKVKWLSLLDDTIDNYYYPFAKAIDNRTIAKCDDNLTDHGIWVDIFPWDDVPEDKKKRKRYLNNCLWLRAVILSMTTDFKHLKFSDSKANLKRILNLFARCIGRKRFYQFAKSYFIKYSGIGSKFICCTFSPYVTREFIEKELMLSNTNLLFEGKKFSAPTNWEYYLQKLYGNYMQLPPENKRRNHHITACWKE